MSRPRILHCHSTFALGGKEARAVRLMNAFGDRAEHVVLSAVPGAYSAREALDPSIRIAFPGDDAPALQGRPGLARYRQLAAYMRDFDLVLTYNWGAMDMVAARRFFPHDCPKLVHHEDGFNADESQGLDRKRNLFRKLVLGAAEALVVPSRKLESIAALHWRRPDAIRIPNGIDTRRYVGAPEPQSIPGLDRQEGDIVIGTVAGLRAVKALPRLVRAVSGLGSNVKLVIVGEGPERDAILAEARQAGMADRLVMPGFLAGPHRFLGHFDIFALSSDSEQFPVSLVEAMAAGLSVVATDVGDVREMVSAPNLPFVVPPGNEAGLAAALEVLADDAELRRALGEANRALADRAYGEARMISAYAMLYGSAIGRPDALFSR